MKHLNLSKRFYEMNRRERRAYQRYLWAKKMWDGDEIIWRAEKGKNKIWPFK